MLLATIAASLFLIISGSIGLYIYFGNHIKETMYHAFLAGSHVLKIQIPLIYLLFIITIPLFMVFDRWMRKQYFKRHSWKKHFPHLWYKKASETLLSRCSYYFIYFSSKSFKNASNSSSNPFKSSSFSNKVSSSSINKSSVTVSLSSSTKTKE